MSIRRLSQETQLNLFERALLYVTQADAAAALGIKVRQIQYWEAQGLLHPEMPAEGRNRKYTKRDLVELRFIKTLVEDCGFTVPSLREKLGLLQAPYDYDPVEIFWDQRDQRWKSRSMLAVELFNGLRERLEPLAAEALERLLPGDSGRAATALMDLVREALEGRMDAVRGGRRRRGPRIKRGESTLE